MSDQDFALSSAGKTQDRERHGIAGTYFDTSELEMLISGASVFSLFQLTGPLERGFDYMMLHFPDKPMLSLVFIYLSMMAYTLIIAFLAHLSVRGFWIAMLGLQSVLPGPMPWDKVKMGPLSSEYIKKRWPTLDTLTLRSDQISSSIFSIAVAFIIIIAYTVIIVVAGGLFSMLVHRLFGFDLVREHTFVFIAIFVIPAFWLSIVDEVLKRRYTGLLDQYPWIRSVWNFLYGFYNLISLAFLYGPIMYRFMAVASKTKVLIFAGLAILSVALLFASVRMHKAGRFEDHSYSRFETRGELVLNPVHYADMHDLSGAMGLYRPFIESPYSKDPYIKLFLPYLPNFNEELDAHCDPLDEAMKASERAQANLSCIQSFFTITLDGQPLADLDFLYHRDPKTKLRGLLTYIPVNRLSPGKHMLKIELGFKADDASPGKSKDKKFSGRERRQRGPHFISFWR